MLRTIFEAWSTSGHSKSRSRAGFTLLELLVSLALAALLACIAVPSYRAQVMRAHRSDARAALLALAAAEESFYTTCNSYAAILDDSRGTSCDASRLNFPGVAGEGAYSLEVSSADVAAWAATATAVIGGGQEADARCRVLGLDSTGHRSADMADGSSNDDECWNR
jgi:type IV pilus assembly protein PilE